MKNVKIIFPLLTVILIAISLILGCGMPASDSGGSSGHKSGGGGGGGGDVVVVVPPIGPAAVELGAAGNYVILAKTTIATTGVTAITGDIGISPAAASFITGFGLVMDSSGTFSTTVPTTLVTGRVYAANYTPPTPGNLTTAIDAMQTAYVDIAGRIAVPANTDLNNGVAGAIGGLTFAPDLYNWTSAVSIGTDITLNGGPNDTWIFQISGALNMAPGVKIILTGGAQPKNIIWQTTGAVTIDSTALLLTQFEGIIFSATAITLNSGATVNGRLYAHSAVALDANTVTRP